jgi:hypothetical protein
LRVPNRHCRRFETRRKLNVQLRQPLLLSACGHAAAFLRRGHAPPPRSGTSRARAFPSATWERGLLLMISRSSHSSHTSHASHNSHSGAFSHE